VSVEERIQPVTIRVVKRDGTTADHDGVERFFVTNNGTLMLMGPNRHFVAAYGVSTWAEYRPVPE
jgi:hypothetical protein